MMHDLAKALVERLRGNERLLDDFTDEQREKSISCATIRTENETLRRTARWMYDEGNAEKERLFETLSLLSEVI